MTIFVRHLMVRPCEKSVIIIHRLNLGVLIWK